MRQTYHSFKGFVTHLIPQPPPPPLQAWQGAFLSFPYIKAEVLARFTRSSHSTANLKALKTAAGEGTDVYLHNLTGILIIVSE